MNAEQLNARLHEARNRIHAELAALSMDIGEAFEVEVSVDWLSVGTMDRPNSRLASVQVTARLVP